MDKIVNVGVLALGASLLFAAPVYAQEEQGSDESTETATAENPNERICRRVHVTGSHIPRRVCMSRSEWTSLREEAQEELEENRRNVESNTSTVNGL
jgi:hypothetical protein